MTRPGSFGVRFLMSAAAAAGALVVWVSLAQREPPRLAPPQDPVVEVIDVTVSASGRVRR